jgi:AraC-like DNA-binding protein
MSGTLSVAILRALLRQLEQAGADTAALLSELSLTQEMLDVPEGRLPAVVVFGVFERAPALTGDELFCLKAAERIPFGALEVLDFSIRSSASVGDAIERTARYYALVDDRTEIFVERHRETARLVGKNLSQPPAPRAATEFLFGMVLARGRGLSGRVCPLAEVHFFQGSPADPSGHERFFGVPVSFSQPRDELIFDASWLDAPSVAHDPELVRFFDRYAKEYIDKISGPRTFVDSVKRAVSERLGGADPTLDAIAKSLGLSERTLQRRLAESGAQFKDLVDEVKKGLALEMLASSSIAIAEVGYVLGFSDASTFYRAFKRWTGGTPADYRRRHR